MQGKSFWFTDIGCATGSYVKFNYGMLKTNNSLADGEIRVAHLPDKEDVVFYRPPSTKFKCHWNFIK